MPLFTVFAVDRRNREGVGGTMLLISNSISIVPLYSSDAIFIVSELSVVKLK